MQDLGAIDKEILRFVFKKGEAQYTDLKTYLKENSICNEKTFVAHKRQLEFGKLLGKKLSRKTRRPVYVIPSGVKRKVSVHFKKEKVKQEFDNLVDSKTEDEFEKAHGAIETALSWVKVFLSEATIVKKREGRHYIYELGTPQESTTTPGLLVPLMLDRRVEEGGDIFYLKKEVVDLLQTYSKKHGKTPTEIIENAIKRYISNNARGSL